MCLLVSRSVSQLASFENKKEGEIYMHPLLRSLTSAPPYVFQLMLGFGKVSRCTEQDCAWN
jgi:hypothetical protein